MKTIFIIGTMLTLLIPANVQGAVPAIRIASGCQADQSYFLTADGRLWGMGITGFSEISPELPIDYYNFRRPEQILVTNVVAVAGGFEFGYMLTADGAVWGSGPGIGEITNLDAGPVGLLPINEITAVSAGNEHGLFLRADGSLWGVGNNDVTRLPAPV